MHNEETYFIWKPVSLNFNKSCCICSFIPSLLVMWWFQYSRFIKMSIERGFNNPERLWSITTIKCLIGWTVPISMLLWLDSEIPPRTKACYCFGPVHTFALQFVEAVPANLDSLSFHVHRDCFQTSLCCHLAVAVLSRLLNGFVVAGQRRVF